MSRAESDPNKPTRHRELLLSASLTQKLTPVWQSLIKTHNYSLHGHNQLSAAGRKWVSGGIKENHVLVCIGPLDRRGRWRRRKMNRRSSASNDVLNKRRTGTFLMGWRRATWPGPRASEGSDFLDINKSWTEHSEMGRVERVSSDKVLTGRSGQRGSRTKDKKSENQLNFT